MYLTQLEYQRQWRQQLKDRGLCVRCRDPNNNDKATCDRCLAQSRDGYRFNIEQNLCPNCGGKKKPGDKKLCSMCRARARGYYQKRKEERNKAHLCVDCGKPLEDKSKQRCYSCLRKAAAKTAKRAKKAKKKRCV